MEVAHVDILMVDILCNGSHAEQEDVLLLVVDSIYALVPVQAWEVEDQEEVQVRWVIDHYHYIWDKVMVQ